MGWKRSCVSPEDHVGGLLLRSLEGYTGPVIAVAVTPDGWQALSRSADNTLKVWELASGENWALFANDAPINRLALSSDGRWLACGDSVGRVWIFEWIK